MITSATLRELATLYPSAAKVFHIYGLDYCCGGKQSLEDACREKQLSPAKLLVEIGREEGSSSHRVRWQMRPLDDLIDYILTRYHASLRQELPRLIDLAAKVEQVHADKIDCPKGLHRLLIEINEAVESHLDNEEQVLFPLIRSGRTEAAFNQIQVMTTEHEEHGANLQKTREIAGNFVLPADACASWRELYRSLEQLEKELMDHIHLENNILFPRVVNAKP